MLVKEILSLSAELLDDCDLKTYIETGACNDEESAKQNYVLLLKCYNLVADEISREYFPLSTVETFTPDNGVILYENFTFNPVLIKSVTTLDGNKADCKIHLVRIFTNSTVKVEYAYSCPERSYNDISDFTLTKVSKRVLAYGVVVEYCLIKGMFEEAVMWRDKYNSGLSACLSVRKIPKIKNRMWY